MLPKRSSLHYHLRFLPVRLRSVLALMITSGVASRKSCINILIRCGTPRE